MDKDLINTVLAANTLKRIQEIEKKLYDLVDIKKGDKGDKPIAGKDYPIPENGEDGEDGYTPIKGIDYFDGENGKTPKKGIDYFDGEDADVTEVALEASKLTLDALKPIIPTIEQIEQDLPKLGEPIRDSLEILQGENRLDKSAIRGIEEIEKKIEETKSVRVIGGARGIQLLVDGTKEGLIQTLNLIPGTGVTLSYNRSMGRNDITISASGSASVPFDAVGDRDDSNVTFTGASEPTLVVINGASYRKTGGSITWTWTLATLTVTLSSPVGVGGDIYFI